MTSPQHYKTKLNLSDVKSYCQSRIHRILPLDFTSTGSRRSTAAQQTLRIKTKGARVEKHLSDEISRPDSWRALPSYQATLITACSHVLSDIILHQVSCCINLDILAETNRLINDMEHYKLRHTSLTYLRVYLYRSASKIIAVSNSLKQNYNK